MRAAVRLVETLAARRNADGGWGAVEGRASNAECTALACLALRAEGIATLRAVQAGGERWLLERQEPGGCWYYNDVGAQATWPTPLALLALRHDPSAAAACARGYAWLLETRGAQFPLLLRLRAFVAGKRAVDLDSTLDAWPWTPGAFPWVEPTSWALLALRARWPDDGPRQVRRRLREGEAMLADRACPTGGWNYGNGVVMGQELMAFPDTTALALLALRGRSGVHIERAFTALAGMLDEHASGLALSLALLCHRAWQRSEAQTLQRRLVRHFADTGTVHDQRTLALGVLALAGDVSPLAGDHA